MLTCKEILDFLMAYLDGELAADQRREFERHLAVCPPCVSYLHTYQKSIELGRAAMKDSDAPPIPEDLVKAIAASRDPRG